MATLIDLYPGGKIRKKITIGTCWEKSLAEDVLERLTKLLNQSIVSHGMIGFPLPFETPEFNLGYICSANRSMFIILREWEFSVFQQKILPFRHGCGDEPVFQSELEFLHRRHPRSDSYEAEVFERRAYDRGTTKREK